MSPTDFATRMQFIQSQSSKDREGAHSDADELLVAVLRELGYGKGCDVYERMVKWYG
jgi:hypothetical protein